MTSTRTRPRQAAGTRNGATAAPTLTGQAIVVQVLATVLVGVLRDGVVVTKAQPVQLDVTAPDALAALPGQVAELRQQLQRQIDAGDIPAAGPVEAEG